MVTKLLFLLNSNGSVFPEGEHFATVGIFTGVVETCTTSRLMMLLMMADFLRGDQVNEICFGR